MLYMGNVNNIIGTATLGNVGPNPINKPIEDFNKTANNIFPKNPLRFL